MDVIVKAAAIVGKGSSLANGYVFYLLLSCLMKPREFPVPKVIRLVSWIGFSAIVSVIIYPGDSVNITGFYFLFLFMNWVAFESGWLMRISVTMLFYPVIIAVNFLMGDVFGRLILLFFAEGTQGNSVVYNLAFLLPLAGWYIYYRFFNKRLGEVSELLDTKSWMLLDVICLASMAAIFSCIYYTPTESYKIIPCMIACIVTNIGSVRLALYMADSIHADLERKNLRIQQDYYKELENNQLQIRRFRHDMKNHFAVAGELLKEECYAEAREYFEQLSGHMETRNRKFCKNGIVNALLNLKYNTAVDQGVDTFFNISIDDMLGIDEISLCTIFANTLDNAVEACERIEECEKRKLSVKARYTENGYFSYEICNSKVNEIREKKGRFLTNKEDKKSHGLGLLSVREIVTRYQGTMDVSYTENEFRVIILIQVT